MFPTHNRRSPCLISQIWRCALVCGLLLALGSALPAAAQTLAPATGEVPPIQLHMPLVAGGLAATGAGCPLTSSNTYTSLPILGAPRQSSRPPLLDPDLNLFHRGYKATTALLELVDIDGPTDADAPQLAHLFRPVRVPAFRAVHQIYDWDWKCRAGGCLGKPIVAPEVTLLEMETLPAEPLYPAGRHANIGEDYVALVLYAEKFRLTFAYTREDTPAKGYVLHIENLCVDPNLLALYQEMDQAGRTHLPGLRRHEILGTASGEKVLVAVRDTGSFMDPRSAKDWWQETVRARLAAQAAAP